MSEYELEELALQTTREYIRFGSRTCLFEAPVFVEMLKQRGFTDAFPLSVDVKVVSPPLAERVKNLGWPKDESTWDRWLQEGIKKPLWFGNTENPLPNSWSGHLVAMVHNSDKTGYLCDLTLPHFVKEAFSVDLPPILVHVAEAFMQGTPRKLISQDCGIVYQARPEDRTFEQTPYWNNPKTPYDKVAKAFLARIQRT